MDTVKAVRAGDSVSLQPIIHSLRYSLDFVVEQLEGLTDDQIVAQPKGVVNHPAWTIGHLAYVLQLIGGVIGVAPLLPAEWPRRYGPSSKPLNDAAAYRPKEEVLTILRSIEAELISTIEQLDEATLDAPFPDPQYLDVFPTIRHALTQVLLGHTAFHVGQIAVWRRAMGLPAMRRSYE